MSNSRWDAARLLARILLGAWFLFAFTTGADAAPPTVWFTPLEHLVRKDGTQGGETDYFALFDPAAPWRTVAAHVAVFKIYPQLLQTASDAELQAMFANLAARHIALALETPILSGISTCGSAGDPPWPRLVSRLKRLNADLRLVAMVGPVTDGHTAVAASGPCHRSMDQIADDAAHTIQMMQSYYPELEFGEIESVGHGRSPTPDEIAAWLEAYKRRTGKPIRFLHTDVTWGGPWQAPLAAVARLCRAAGVPLGVIYKGDFSDLSNAAFTAHALREADEVEALLGGPPDQVVFQSWENFPRRALPESDPTTMTGLVMQYLRPPSHLTALPGGQVRLSGEGNRPAAGEMLAVQVHDPAPGTTLEDEIIAGIVPHRAVTARFLLHLDGGPSASGGIELTQPRFNQESGGAQPSSWTSQPLPTQPSPSGLWQNGALVVVDGGRTLNLVGPPFPVVADKPFSGQFDWQAEPAQEGTGYAAIVFAGPDGVEMRRTLLALRTSWRRAGVIRTGLDGSAALPLFSAKPGTLRRVEYAGSRMRRPVILSLDSR